jgi:hypothetical protein
MPDPKLDPTDFGVIILGDSSALRNPDLLDIHPEIQFVDPVYLGKTFRQSLRGLILEFILNGKFLTNGERGCSLAHIGIRREILASDRDWTLVLEDDVGLAKDWVYQISQRYPGFPSDVPPGIILLNTNPYYTLGPTAKPLNLHPSLANAFLVHRSSLESRKSAHLDSYQIADWPCSFFGVHFWTVSEVASDLNLQSTIGYRPKSRIRFVATTVLLAALSPIFSLVAGIPLRTYFAWCVFGPIKRDLVLRWRNSIRPFFEDVAR